MKLILIAGFVFASTSGVFAQGTSQTGSFSGGFAKPAWGQYGGTAWGSYSGGIGQSGWNYNSQLRPNEPVGSVLADPNTMSSNFANPRTGATLYQPQDTRLKGRDRP
jgi:hypothetical protein